jgi:hypothetical protein
LASYSLGKLIKEKPQQLTKRITRLITANEKLRASIISIGIPILLPDGKSMLRGPEIKIPPYHGKKEVAINADELNKWAHDGWVDLREANMELWQRRVHKIFEEINTLPPNDNSSRFYRDVRYWVKDGEINIGKLVSWVVLTEEHGERIK